MQAWHENEKFDFTFQNAHDLVQARDSSTEETIKRSLKTRLNSSDVFLVLVGQSTKNLYKYVRWEIEVAIELNIPIIVVNLDKARSINYDLCPPILRDQLAIHVPFGSKIIDYSIRNWPSSAKSHKSKGESGPYSYKQSVYDELGL
jgi:hypothetical protein